MYNCTISTSTIIPQCFMFVKRFNKILSISLYLTGYPRSVKNGRTVFKRMKEMTEAGSEKTFSPRQLGEILLLT